MFCAEGSGIFLFLEFGVEERLPEWSGFIAPPSWAGGSKGVRVAKRFCCDCIRNFVDLGAAVSKDEAKVDSALLGYAQKLGPDVRAAAFCLAECTTL